MTLGKPTFDQSDVNACQNEVTLNLKTSNKKKCIQTNNLIQDWHTSINAHDDPVSDEEFYAKYLVSDLTSEDD